MVSEPRVIHNNDEALAGRNFRPRQGNESWA